jgi:hypothetical protein
MAHESFEDPGTAEEMNRLFVNVKVDREERPDVDSIYMEAVQAMTGQGGWPMTVIMTPDGQPFFAGTYFPDQPRHGMASFREVLAAVAAAWDTRRNELMDQAEELTGAIQRSIPGGDMPVDEAILRSAYENIINTFDPTHGGFGGAPKFPQQPVLEFLLRIHNEPWADRADEALTTTLTRMARGGIHDHLAGGFARYSVDNVWLVPHFEKMLYDNAQLARVYLWAGIELGVDEFVGVARRTLDYLLTDLSHPEGGFYSAEDADSEGVEGKFYVWSYEELTEVVDLSDAQFVSSFFDVTQEGNSEGTNILNRQHDTPWDHRIEKARKRLLERRSSRVRPGLDDKVITAWNGLAIRVLAEAGAVLDDSRYLQAARNCATFVMEQLMVDGKLKRSWRNGTAGVDAFLEDHSSMAVGLLSLYAATGEHRWFQTAEDLARGLNGLFGDPAGGFYDNSSDDLIKRPKSQMDNPLPSGNALAAEALFMLGAYTGEAALIKSASSTLAAGGLLMARYPSMVGRHLAVAHSMSRSRELAIVGPDWKKLSTVYWARFRPETVLAGSNDGSEPIPLLEHRSQADTTRAFVCRGFVCDLPVNTKEELRAQLA